MSFTTIYPLDIASPVNIPRESYNNVGSLTFTLGSIPRYFKGSTFELWDAKSGGNKLTIVDDYTLELSSSYYEGLAGEAIYLGVKIVNVIYQSGPIFATYDTIGSPTSADFYNTIQESSSGIYRNPIINGDKVITQRGDFTTPAAILSSVYAVDRFRSFVSGVTATFQHVSADQPPALSGSWSTKYVATSTATGVMGDIQIVEDVNYNKLLGKTIQASVWVKSNSTDARMLAFDGSSFASSPAHSGSGDWELLTVSVLLISDFSIRVVIADSQSATVSITSGDYIESTGVTANEGTVLFPFQPRHHSEELALCQRYYEVGPGIDLFAGDVTSGVAYLNSVNYAVSKRAATQTIVLGHTLGVHFPATAPTIGTANTNGFRCSKVANATGTGGYYVYNWTAESEL